MVERDVANVQVAGSNPVSRSIFPLEAQVDGLLAFNQEVVGSRPTGRTIFVSFYEN